jgi:O-antigen biosynthesis protein
VKENVLVSVIVVCRDSPAYTRLCVDRVLRHSGRRFELILVDNGSSGPARRYLASVRKARRIRNEKNLGFARALNQGIRSARGKFLLFLNNDVVVTPGYLDGLVAVLRRDRRLGAVAPLSNPPDRTVFRRSAGPPRIEWKPFYGDEAGLHRFAWALASARERVSENASPGGFSCFCHLVRRDMVRRIGGMDERFSPAYVEDIDFFYRAVRAGWKLARRRSVFVHHFWGITSRARRANVKALVRLGKKRFIEKWGRRAWSEAHRIR